MRTRPLRLNLNGLIPHRSNRRPHQLIQERGGQWLRCCSPVSDKGNPIMWQFRRTCTDIGSKHDADMKRRTGSRLNFLSLLVFHLWKHLSSRCWPGGFSYLCGLSAGAKMGCSSRLPVHCCCVQKINCTSVSHTLIYLWRPSTMSAMPATHQFSIFEAVRRSLVLFFSVSHT